MARSIHTLTPGQSDSGGEQSAQKYLGTCNTLYLRSQYCSTSFMSTLDTVRQKPARKCVALQTIQSRQSKCSNVWLPLFSSALSTRKCSDLLALSSAAQSVPQILETALNFRKISHLDMVLYKSRFGSFHALCNASPPDPRIVHLCESF
jgi:hypothetical protein